MRALGYGYDATLHEPSQCHLCGGLAVAFANRGEQLTVYHAFGTLSAERPPCHHFCVVFGEQRLDALLLYERIALQLVHHRLDVGIVGEVVEAPRLEVAHADKFAVMNPERTFTLPPYQTAAGVVDIIMHTLERYFSHDDDMTVTDSIAESLIRTVQDSAFKVLQQPDNYLHRAQIMWASSLSHNGLTGCGTTSDWATHFLEHELSGMFDVTHGAGLAAVWSSWARYVYLENPTRFAQFAVNAMGVRNNFKSAEETALAGIEALERFFRAIGMPTSIHELIGREITDEEIREMSRKCSYDGTHSIGGFKVLNREDMEHIYRAAR